MDYEKSMKKCINLALKGAGSVSPNPLVGCVVYNRDLSLIHISEPTRPY